jgi:Flp pilus assembly protein TadD
MASIFQKAISLLMGMILVSSLSGCSTAAVTASAAGAMANAMTTSAMGKESRLRAEQQSQMQAFEDAQLPKFEKNAASYAAMIGQMQREGLWFASLAHIDALDAQWKPSEQSRLLRADALRQTGKKVESAALYKQLLSGQHAARALHGMGLLAASEGNFNEAIAHMEIARKRAPTDALLLNDLGYALMQTNRGADAGFPLKQAAQLEPKNPRIQSNLALYLVVFGEAREALAWMNQSAMSKEQRLRVLEQARNMGVVAKAVAGSASEVTRTAEPMPVVPVAPSSNVCEGCLIFEKRLPTLASAS